MFHFHVGGAIGLHGKKGRVRISFAGGIVLRVLAGPNRDT